MAILPPELLHLIIAQVALHFVYYPDQGWLKKDLGTLRSLRLAHRKLCEVASKYLFEEVTLYFTEASHAKMMAIAQHPTYSAYPRLMGISPKAIFGPYLDRNEFGQWFHQARPLVICDGYDEGYLYVPQRMNYLPTKKSGVIDFHHAAYTSLYKKQEQLFAKAGDFLRTAIGCFSRLEQVASSVRTARSAYYVPSTDDAFISDLWQDSACLHKYDLDHAALILTAISQGRSLAATHIEIGDLFYKVDTMVIDLPDPVASRQIQNLVADTKNINLSIQASNVAGLRQLLNTGRLQRLLGLVKNLESLSCSTYELQGSPLPRPPISDVLGDNTWPHLSRLGLCGFHVSTSKLSKILSRHRSTLQKLTLQHILLRKGTWHDVFVKLRGALRTVEIHHLGCEKDPDDFFGHFHELQLVNPIPYSHPLHAFLFRGAAWVPQMEDVLEGIEPDAEGFDSDVFNPDATDPEALDSDVYYE